MSDLTPNDRLLHDGLALAFSRVGRPPRRWPWFALGAAMGFLIALVIGGGA